MRVKINLYHRVCRSIILSDVDDYTKALAQRGLGTWYAGDVPAQAATLLPSIAKWQGDDARFARAVLRRYRPQ